MIDGEELVRHTEDLISVAEDSKTTYAQRVYRLRKEVSRVHFTRGKLPLNREVLKFLISTDNPTRLRKITQIPDIN